MLTFAARIETAQHLMEQNFRDIEKKWQQWWNDQGIYKTEIDPNRPKYYVLDMFPYPSGAGLHVGHPLGYIASDIISRYKRLKGFNVLHPMGFDAFGLPAEQYAIQTGRHPADTTAENTARYKQQLNNIGFCYDWNREVNTSDPSYYRWTQWIFLQLFQSWFNLQTQKAEPISSLEQAFATSGSTSVQGACDAHDPFTAEQWAQMDHENRQSMLMKYRLAYQDYATVNWCEALGTVLANDEVKDGLSERGGHPVEKRKMRQWFLRITAYAERLLNDLESLEWTDSMKEMQRNWIGRSEGAMVKFALAPENRPAHGDASIEVFTTRPDTLFGVDFLTLAPEHELVATITTADRKEAVEAYVNVAKNRSERERMADVKRISGEFTGAYALHPFSGKKIPVWVGDYVLAGYGTGAVMAVPAGDQRDWDFARHFGMEMTAIHEGIDISEAANPTKEARLMNSDFLNGLNGYEGLRKAIEALEAKGIGKGKVNYRLRDAGFSRQRYWGEPFPIVYQNGIATPLNENELPLELPVMDDFKPTGQPESPLAKAHDWLQTPHGARETDTMPGYAGSSWYFLRYMDAQNAERFVGKDAEAYWQDVDLYIGGTEHAVGHLLYARFWQKVLFDLGHVSKNEPFRKLINQGMILGVSAKIKVCKFTSNVNYFEGSSINGPSNLENLKTFQGDRKFIVVSEKYLDQVKNGRGNEDAREQFKSENLREVYVPLTYINEKDNTLKIKEFGESDYCKSIIGPCIFMCDNERPVYFENPEFSQIGDTTFTVQREVEKMSKSKYNVVNPDDIIEAYGADTLRLYEMFLGPLEQSKPWNTNGIEGVYRFFRKLWNLFYAENGVLKLHDAAPTEQELRILHKTIRKVEEDMERFSFNTSVSTFMIAVNEFHELKCCNRAVLKDFVILLAPYAPHIAEELWHAAGGQGSVVNATFPAWNEAFIRESSVSYPVAFNGKTRYQIQVPADMPQQEVQAIALAHEEAERWLQGAAPKKVIVVPGRMVNVVI